MLDTRQWSGSIQDAKYTHETHYTPLSNQFFRSFVIFLSVIFLGHPVYSRYQNIYLGPVFVEVEVRQLQHNAGVQIYQIIDKVEISGVELGCDIIS